MNNYIFFISVIVVLAIAVCFITYRGLHLDNDQYDRLKSIVINWSAIVALLAAIVSTFPGIPYGTETITVVAAIGAFLAKCLNVSNKNHNDGALIKDDDEPLEDEGPEFEAFDPTITLAPCDFAKDGDTDE